MKYRSYKLVFFLTFIFLGLFSSKAMASDVFNFKIQNDVQAFISDKDTSAYVDEEQRQITLPKVPLSDIVKFTQEGTTDYAVLTKDGLQQYIFDGQKEVLVNSLSVNITDPLSMAVATNPNGYASFSIVQLNATDNTYDIRNYGFDGTGMSEIPALNISGLQTVYSLSKTSSGLAVLTDKDVKLFDSTGSDMVDIPQLGINDIQDPIALATSSNGYDIAVLKKDKAEYYKFDGTSMMNIPALSVSVDQTQKRPKAISIKENSVSILYDTQIKTHQFNDVSQKMEYHAMLSITSGLVKPIAFALRKDVNDIVVIDEVDSVNKKYRAKYFMFDGTQMVEIEALENDIPNVTVGDRYSQEAVLISNVFITQAAYSDFIRVRAYTETPKGTSITFYVANAGDDPTNANWQESWKIENVDGSTDGVVSKYVSIDSLGNKGYQVYGTPEEAYPTFDSKPDPGNGTYTDTDINIATDVNGNPILTVPDNPLLNLWTKVPIDDLAAAKLSGQYKKIRFKAVLKSTDPMVTPKIFAPIGTNNVNGVINSDETAIKLEADAQPEMPIISPIDPESGDPILYPPVDGWVYTTTPTINYTILDSDTLIDPLHLPIASQVLVLSKDGTGNWKLAYNSQVIRDQDIVGSNSIKVPTSYEPDIDGPLYLSNSYQFAVFVRVWDALNVVSDFSTGRQFKVLAFERPRIANIVNSPSSIAPKLNDRESHFMIKPGMTKDDLAVTKAGAQVTLLVDSVGPIKSLPTDISKFYIDVGGVPYEMALGDCESANVPGISSTNNRWKLNFWTNAPITTIPDGTVVKANFVGTGEIGGTTVFYIPSFAEGVIKTSDTIYQDWIVTLQGSDRSN